MFLSLPSLLGRLWLAAVLVGPAIAASTSTYFPPRDAWARRTPAELGLDPAKLAEAIRYAQSQESTWPVDFSEQEENFGSLLGSMPTRRARPNGLVIYRGYVVAEFGDTTWIDPTYSVAKSMLATVAGIAVRDGLIPNVEEPVGSLVKDGGYASPRNAQVTWRMHLQQESEWEGALWGKAHDFVGKDAFGKGARPPRALQAPGSYYEYNDVRINRFALSLLQRFRRPVPEVFRDEIMDVIGASNAWKWIPYHNSYVAIDGRRLPSVSGGTRWGGGVWIHAWDLARFGYLWLREGRWEDRQVLPPAYVRAALKPSAHGPDYGFLWWLNTQGKNYPGLPATAYGARGAGFNTIVISPEHDLVVVWRWHAAYLEGEFARRVIDAIGR